MKPRVTKKETADTSNQRYGTPPKEGTGQEKALGARIEVLKGASSMEFIRPQQMKTADQIMG